MARLSFILVLFLLTSCASPVKNIQPQVNSLVAAQRPERALSFLRDDPNAYGAHNQLLYWLDRGMAAQLSARYNESISAFEQAKQKYDELYTRSISQSAAAWAVNDYAQDYRGDDHEYVMLNIAQALNFAALGNIDEALVEARDVDQKLNMINARYKEGQKNVYKDDAFARFLSGILWEATGTPEGLNDAYIAYTRALKVYEEDYRSNYGITPPQILKDNLEVSRDYMERGRRPSMRKAEVYIFEYCGYAPLKVSDSLPLPLGGVHVTKVAFPRYIDRSSEVSSSLVAAIQGKQEYFKVTELGQDLGAIAKKIMDNRKVMIWAKVGIRPLVKQVAERAVEHQVRGKYGDLPADIVGILGSVYNLATEEPDLRTWQTLPAQVRVAKLVLEPGTYEISIEDLDAEKVLVEKRSLGSVTLAAGEKKFLLSRGYR